MATFPRQTPQITSEGLFVLRAPFAALLKANTIYTVEAIRSFQELHLLNSDIFKEYYDPLGLTESEYKDDAAADVFIITLTAKIPFSDSGDATESVIYVPDSYILKYPDGNAINYYNFILAIELGPLPEWFETSQLSDDIRDLVKAKTGLYIGEPTQPEVKIFKNSHPSVVSANDSVVLEQARIALVTDNDPTVTKLRMALEQLAALQVKYDSLAAYIIAHPPEP